MPSPRVSEFASRLDGRLAVWPGTMAACVDERLIEMDRTRMVEGLYAKRTALWSDDPAVQATIAGRLGWLDAPDWILPLVPRLERFAEDVRARGTTHVVLLGMGGSSLAPEVIRAVMGVRPGWPAFRMLDSTDPASVAAVDAAIDLPRTLFLLASKSGGTIEPNSMAAHFRGRLEALGLARWSDHFVAITDEGTALHRRAVAEGFRDLFLNPSDIGGRYSALSFFGLVPAALMGHSPAAIVDWARAMLWLCGPHRPLTANPAARLAAVMAAGALSGRDKLTLVAPDDLSAIGLWADQLVAESTGKQGRGLIPVVGERLGAPRAYGSDRVMVHLGHERRPDAAARDRLREIAADGTPLVQIELVEPAAVGAEFVRWELATAMAGALVGVNPFDEPNVQQAKDATGRLLDAHRAGQPLTHPARAAVIAGVSARLSKAACDGLGNRPADAFLSLLRTGDYFAILAYLGPDPQWLEPLERLREAVRAETRCATTFGYGPRYLHSTGQLHKGGPNTGVYLVITAEPAADITVPGEAFSFGVLERAQAVGDFASLDAAGRRALHVNLPAHGAGSLERVCADLLHGMTIP